MKREDLEEKKKEDLIYMIIGMEEDIKIFFHYYQNPVSL